MKTILLITMTLLLSTALPILLFEFTPQANLSTWRVVNDGVMGGRSNSKFELTPAGKGSFKGTISLENNGGFASVRHRLSTYDVSQHQGFRLRLKGDGKRYQFRVKENYNDAHSYITYLQTSKEWAVYTVKFEDLYPSFRGRRLNRPNFEGIQIEQVGFLIANKKAENFHLQIDHLALD